MDFIISANTDIGIKKKINQDSLSVKVMNTEQGRMAFAILCDGMGGLSEGEFASSSIIKAFDKWIFEELPQLCTEPLSDVKISNQWNRIIKEQNQFLIDYGQSQDIRVGTTVVAVLVTQKRYYILNVGDSRAYELTDDIKQITQDHSVVAREVALGKMSEEQASIDSRKHILWQCVGVSKRVKPDMFCGDVHEKTIYLLCSDGFCHEITAKEIYEYLRPDNNCDEVSLDKNAIELIEINKERKEKDNISVLMIKTL